jgi:hypothetical protein
MIGCLLKERLCISKTPIYQFEVSTFKSRSILLYRLDVTLQYYAFGGAEHNISASFLVRGAGLELQARYILSI